MRFAVFASGFGSNLQTIINAVKARKIHADLVLVISDQKKAKALTRAKSAKIPAVFVDPKKFKDKQEFEKEILRHLKAHKVNFIVLAGYMRILSRFLVSKYRHKILNVHPSMLPQFKGQHAIEDAFEAGVDTTGVTIHFVDEKIDHGPIIMQEPVTVDDDDTLDTLEIKLHEVEHRIYPMAIDMFARGKLKVRDDQTVIKEMVL